MKTHQLRVTDLNSMKIVNRLIVSVIISFSSSAYAQDNYQQNALFSPTSQQLQAEENGRVMIYDGLKSEIIDLALHEQFHRIENMMFVRTQYLQNNGDYETGDDDCD